MKMESYGENANDSNKIEVVLSHYKDKEFNNAKDLNNCEALSGQWTVDNSSLKTKESYISGFGSCPDPLGSFEPMASPAFLPKLPTYNIPSPPPLPSNPPLPPNSPPNSPLDDQEENEDGDCHSPHDHYRYSPVDKETIYNFSCKEKKLDFVNSIEHLKMSYKSDNLEDSGDSEMYPIDAVNNSEGGNRIYDNGFRISSSVEQDLKSDLSKSGLSDNEKDFIDSKTHYRKKRKHDAQEIKTQHDSDFNLYSNNSNDSDFEENVLKNLKNQNIYNDEFIEKKVYKDRYYYDKYSKRNKDKNWHKYKFDHSEHHWNSMDTNDFSESVINYKHDIRNYRFQHNFRGFQNGHRNFRHNFYKQSRFFRNGGGFRSFRDPGYYRGGRPIHHRRHNYQDQDFYEEIWNENEYHNSYLPREVDERPSWRLSDSENGAKERERSKWHKKGSWNNRSYKLPNMDEHMGVLEDGSSARDDNENDRGSENIKEPLRNKYPETPLNFDQNSNDQIINKDGELEPGEYISDDEHEGKSEHDHSKEAPFPMDTNMRYTPEQDYCEYDQLLYLEKQRLRKEITAGFHQDEFEDHDSHSDKFDLVPSLFGGKNHVSYSRSSSIDNPSFREDFDNVSSLPHSSRGNSPLPITVDTLKRLTYSEPARPAKTVPLIKRLGLVDLQEEKDLNSKTGELIKDADKKDPGLAKMDVILSADDKDGFEANGYEVNSEESLTDMPNSSQINKNEVQEPVNKISFSKEASTSVESIKQKCKMVPQNDEFTSPKKEVSKYNDARTSNSKSPQKGGKLSRHTKTAEKNKKDKIIMLQYLSKLGPAGSNQKAPLSNKSLNESPIASLSESPHDGSKSIKESPIRPNLDSRLQVLLGNEKNVEEAPCTPKKKLISPFSADFKLEPLSRPPSPFRSRASYLLWLKETSKFRRNNNPPNYPFFDPVQEMNPLSQKETKSTTNGEKLHVRKLSFDLSMKNSFSSPNKLNSKSISSNKGKRNSLQFCQPLPPPPLPPPSLLSPALSKIHDKIREVSETIVPKMTHLMEAKANRLSSITDTIQKEPSTAPIGTPIYPPLPSEPPPPLPDGPCDSSSNTDLTNSNTDHQSTSSQSQKHSEMEKEMLRLVLLRVIGDLKTSLKRSLTDGIIEEAIPDDHSTSKRTKAS